VSVGVDGQFAVVVYGLAFRTMVRIRPRRRSDFRRCSACLVGGFGSSASFDRFFGNERSLGFRLFRRRGSDISDGKVDLFLGRIAFMRGRKPQANNFIVARGQIKIVVIFCFASTCRSEIINSIVGAFLVLKNQPILGLLGSPCQMQWSFSFLTFLLTTGNMCS